MGVPRWGEARRHTRSATVASDVDAVADLPVSAALLATLPKSQVDHVRLELRSCLRGQVVDHAAVWVWDPEARAATAASGGARTAPGRRPWAPVYAKPVGRIALKHVTLTGRRDYSPPSRHRTPKAGCAAGDAAYGEPIARHRRRRVNAPHNRRVPSSDEQLHQSRYVLRPHQQDPRRRGRVRPRDQYRSAPSARDPEG